MATLTIASETAPTSPATMSRPIERLPARRQSNEPKEAMNCKSCRKRKIKCNRLRPSCGACQVFNCACIYDAVPKKRGPKTDVLEALLKRVNGLEKQLKDEHKRSSPEQSESTNTSQEASEDCESQTNDDSDAQPRLRLDYMQPAPTSQPPSTQAGNLIPNDVLIDCYFVRLHAKPFYVLDEPTTRERLRDGVLPRFIVDAIHAVSIRHTPHLAGGYFDAIQMSKDLVKQARAAIDIDEPSIDHLQALLLLSIANHQNGRGKSSYMMLSHAIGMSYALNLHCELPAHLRITLPEREGRRKLFWTVYYMDRFTASGSTRPSLISDESIRLKLPARHVPGSQQILEGDFFPNASNPSFAPGAQNAVPDSGKMLVEIVRILGITNRYLAAGGVKGDSHFPWHGQSTLSRIRSDLDHWAANTHGVVSSTGNPLASPNTSILVLSRLVYHLVHCLIYRPFLPLDLAELSGTGQNQSWQVDATNICFLNANAIVEIVEVGKSNSMTDWPSFISFCICTAASVHVHGAHYVSFSEEDVYHRSADFLSREMSLLLDLRTVSIGAEHQRSTLQLLYTSHTQLVKSLSANPMRFSPVFHTEDFFDRYGGAHIDGSYVSFNDIVIDPTHHSLVAQSFVGFDVGIGSTRMQNVASTPYQIFTTSENPTQDTSNYTDINDIRRTRAGKSSSSTGVNPVPSPAVVQEMHGIPVRRKQPSAKGVSGPFGDIGENVGFSDDPTLGHGPTSPSFHLTPFMSTPIMDFQGLGSHSSPNDMVPISPGLSNTSATMEAEQDPFLSLLEQLGENEGMSLDGPSIFDFSNEDG